MLLTDHVVCNLWLADDGSQRMHWSISRGDRYDATRSYRTFRPEHLLEVPEVIRRLAEGFAKHPTISAELQAEFRNLAALLTEVVDLLQDDGDSAAHVNGHDQPTTVLGD